MHNNSTLVYKNTITFTIMAARNDDSLLFVVEWFDPLPMMKKQYLLKLFTDQHMVEMVDLKSRKMFLRKSPCPNELTKDDFYVGSKICLYSRELEIIDYGDIKTKERLFMQVQQCVVILPSCSYNDWGKTIQKLNHDMVLTKVKTIIMSQSTADRVCGILNIGQRKNSEFSSGVNLVVQLQGPDGFNKVEDVVANSGGGPIYSTTNNIQSTELQELLFNNNTSSTATYDSCTCVIVKPHSIKSGDFGAILEHITRQGYEVSAAQSMQFERAQAEEFLKVYKGVIPDFADHVTQLCLGISVALEVRAENAVRTFRETAGPWDIEMAKELRPDTIRGQYGLDRSRSAVHCTDLPQDGLPECEYCFKIMQ